MVVRRVVEQDWAALRSIRLEMLTDSPSAYLETVADAETRTESEWRFRAQRGATGHTNLGIAAEPATEPGRWAAFMACLVDAPDRAHLVSVYVTPAHRGTGLADQMVGVVRDWARDEAAVSRLHLYVHEDNQRARAFYRRLGFTETGAWLPYELVPTERDLEMDLAL
jgi:ribosomal protein S18 acetylase RimI-like enzyme